jgi:hypothetical protein
VGQASKEVMEIFWEKSLQLIWWTKHSLKAVSNTISSVFLQFFLDFDAKAFEAECRKIVQDISDRFLDLGLDEGGSHDYGNLM